MSITTNSSRRADGLEARSPCACQYRQYRRCRQYRQYHQCPRPTGSIGLVGGGGKKKKGLLERTKDGEYRLKDEAYIHAAAIDARVGPRDRLDRVEARSLETETEGSLKDFIVDDDEDEQPQEVRRDYDEEEDDEDDDDDVPASRRAVQFTAEDPSHPFHDEILRGQGPIPEGYQPGKGGVAEEEEEEEEDEQDILSSGEIEEMTVKELKDQLKLRNLITKGNKAILKDRLKEALGKKEFAAKKRNWKEEVREQNAKLEKHDLSELVPDTEPDHPVELTEAQIEQISRQAQDYDENAVEDEGGEQMPFERITTEIGEEKETNFYVADQLNRLQINEKMREMGRTDKYLERDRRKLQQYEAMAKFANAQNQSAVNLTEWANLEIGSPSWNRKWRRQVVRYAKQRKRLYPWLVTNMPPWKDQYPYNESFSDSFLLSSDDPRYHDSTMSDLFEY